MSYRFLTILVLSLTIFVAACDSEGDSEPNGLIGTWSLTAVEIDASSAVTFNGTTITSANEITGSDLNYEVTFTEAGFTAEGSYTLNYVITAAGITTESSLDLSNVSGTGTYSTNGSELTISGQLFQFELNGQPVTASGEDGTVQFQINGNELILSQEESMTTTVQGATSVVNLEMSSTWVRK